MDLSCIILSGDLELYVLGMLPSDEANKIAQLALIFPEVQSELDRIAASLEGLVSVSAQAPSSSVKENIMSRLSQLKEEEQKIIPFGAATENENYQKGNLWIESEDKEEHLPGHRSWLTAASLIGLVLSLGALFYFISQNKQSRSELASVKQQADTLRLNAQAQQKQILAYSQTMQMMHDDGYKKINLTNVPGKPQAMAQVFWNTKTHDVFIADVSLPQAPSDKQYQLWAIVDGKPVDAGMMSDAKNLAQKMKVFEKAQAFAITLEKKGGNPTPLGEMYVLGKT